MLSAICIILIAMTWLMYESNGLSVNLPCGASTATTQPVYEIDDTSDCEDDNDTDVEVVAIPTPEIESITPDLKVLYKPSDFQPGEFPELSGELNILSKVVN
jgi:hypothetical protein